MKHDNALHTEAKQLLELAKNREIISLREIRKAGLSSMSASRLVQKGELERLGRGLYRRTDAPVSEFHDMIRVLAQAEHAVIVLISALRFHELGTQIPHAVWVQISASSRIPKIDWPPIEIVKTRIPALMEEGVETHILGGVPVPITNPARTVADCFKYRNKIGLDVCLEALKELIRRDRNTLGEITKYAQLNKVFNVMRPYLEASV